MTNKQVLALGGGGFSDENIGHLDRYLVQLSSAVAPKICFIPTASADSADYMVRFYKMFSKLDCRPSHLELFRRTEQDITGFLTSQDIIFVGGGNTANMLAIWQVHGVDQALRQAYEGGAVLSGISAGSICWFDVGVTDSFGGELAGLPGLGLLPGSNCPHFDSEPLRRPTYKRLVKEGMAPGYAADDGAALHFVDGVLHRAVSSRPGSKGYRISLQDGEAVEEELSTAYLGSM